MRRLLIMVAALSLAISSAGAALAHHQNLWYFEHIVVSAPTHYGSCVDAVTSDVLSITNVHHPDDPNDKWYLNGQVRVEYITDAGRVLAPGGLIPINNHVGDLVLEIFYPPVSEWPVLANGTAEIHVDIQLEVYTEPGHPTGFKIGDGIGPGHDWDVFCISPPPPPPPPPGTQGCTPGYWKNHLSAWADAGYSPNQKFGAVFGVTATGDPTLQQAANTGGGGEEALFRHATAALLNAGHAGVEYPYTTAQVIQFVQDAYASGNFEAAKDKLEAANELGCSLDGYENTTGGGPPVGVKAVKKDK